MAEPEITSGPASPAPDSLDLLRGHVNDLAAAFGKDVGELARRLAAAERLIAEGMPITSLERLTVTPNDCLIFRLPAAAFDPDEGVEPMAQTIARVAADVLGTRRVLVLEDAAQITVAPIPPDADA